MYSFPFIFAGWSSQELINFINIFKESDFGFINFFCCFPVFVLYNCFLIFFLMLDLGLNCTFFTKMEASVIDYRCLFFSNVCIWSINLSSQRCFHCFLCILINCIFIFTSKYILKFLIRFFFDHMLLRSTLFNLYIFGNLATIFLLWIASLIRLCENTHCMISILSNCYDVVVGREFTLSR